MAKYFYTTVENQIRSNGTAGLLYDHFGVDGTESDEQALNRAYAKLYTILAAAAVSEIPYHSGHIYRSDGLLIEGKVFDRRQESEGE